jgi:hypothetical protein
MCGRGKKATDLNIFSHIQKDLKGHEDMGLK